MLGKIVSYKREQNIIKFEFENGIAFVEVLNERIFNVFVPLKYEEHFSRAIEKRKYVECEIVINESNYNCDVNDRCIEIKTKEIVARVYNNLFVDFYDAKGNRLCEDYRNEREPFIRRGNVSISENEGHKVEKNSDRLKIEVVKKMYGDEAFYGLGDKSGHLNKRGYQYEMWNTDDPSPHVESHKSLYKSIPFFITKRDSAVFGIFFDNTFKSSFDMGKENSKYYWFGANDGNLDYYFIGGEDIKEVIKGYTSLTGTTPLPQLWTLGYHQCRWSYAPESRLLEIVDELKKNDLPCDCIHLDIDYMDSYKVFTWDNKKFSDEKNLLRNLKEDGLKIVTIIDPGVKKEKGYKIFDEGMKNQYFATDKDGITYVNAVWPGDSVYPDFSNKPTRDWWAQNQQIMMEAGVSGIWNDMNEPASFNGPLPDDVYFKNDGRETDHTEIHNVYGHLMSKATFDGIKQTTNKRPFVITRAAYAGTQKYSTVWTGDNQSFWEHLRMLVPMLMNLGMSGFSFCGTDVGGFGFDCTAELLSRWVQVGCFSALFRNHTTIHSRDQEPWAFDKQTLDINRKYIKLRYKLLPYLYDVLWQGEKTGLPLIRPLIMHYENDKNVYELNDQFMVGESIMVAPVLEQGKRARMVYLPKGEWYDYWTKEAISGGKYIIREAELDTCPIYIKSGAIIPNYPEQHYVGEVEVKKLKLDIYPGNGNYTHYVDDKESFDYQDGKYSLYDIKLQNNNKNLVMNIENSYNRYQKYDGFSIVLNNTTADRIEVNGENVCFKCTEGCTVFEIEGVKATIVVSQRG